MKLKALKTYQSVKTGLGEKTFLTQEDFEITLQVDTGLITIKDEKGLTLTSLSNMAWGKPDDEQVKSTESVKRDTTKKTKTKAKLGNQKLSKTK